MRQLSQQLGHQLRVGNPGNQRGEGDEEFGPRSLVPLLKGSAVRERTARRASKVKEATGRTGTATARYASSTVLKPAVFKPTFLRPAVLRPALLAIPRIDDSVPSSIVLDRGGSDTAIISEALLAAKILEPSDWKGELSESVSAGLFRWANEVMGAQSLKHFNLTLMHGNNPEKIVDMEMEAVDNPSVRDGSGAFALTLTNFDNVTTLTIGERITALNQVREGLGWAVLAVLDQALRVSIGACTPAWARDMMEGWADGSDAYGDLGEEVPEDDYTAAYHAGAQFGQGEIITLKQFDSAVPIDATSKLKTNNELLESLWQDMQSSPEGTFPEWVQLTVSEAFYLANAMYEARRKLVAGGSLSGLCRLHEFDKNPMKPILLWWNDSDFIGAIFDDYHNMHFEDGYLTNALWMTLFKCSDPASVIKSAEALRFAIATVVQCDSLISLISGPVPVHTPTLIEVFASEERIRVR